MDSEFECSEFKPPLYCEDCELRDYMQFYFFERSPNKNDSSNSSEVQPVDPKVLEAQPVDPKVLEAFKNFRKKLELDWSNQISDASLRVTQVKLVF